MKLFDKINPVFYIDNEMATILKEIDNKLNDIEINDRQKRKYMISKSKVRSIHSSLAIEVSMLNLPIYFYTYDLEKYKEETGLNFDFDKDYGKNGNNYKIYFYNNKYDSYGIMFLFGFYLW